MIFWFNKETKRYRNLEQISQNAYLKDVTLDSLPLHCFLPPKPTTSTAFSSATNKHFFTQLNSFFSNFETLLVFRV
ncbi:hypothetical protein VNO80_05208 [Phaseolus coccineus]|uniref:Uncharacterized protein n=1 Tax=Phaseolus coccineus TaxID=3886 RepID=A0AAN9NJD8_PHACN